jgi:ABC-type oligopeptide transport system substrate-binding subunit
MKMKLPPLIRTSITAISGLILVALVCLPSSALSEAAPINIGVPEFPADLNIANGTDIVSRLMRDFSTSPLVSSSPLGFASTNSVSNYISVKNDPPYLKVRINRRITCSEGSRVSPQDVDFSLRRCGLSELVASDVSVSRNDRGNTEYWIELKPEEGTVLESLAEAFAGCPIYKSHVAKGFGEDFGQGTNYAACGPFSAQLWRAGAEIHLVRNDSARARAERIAIKGVTGKGRGLGLLRAGQLDLLFAPDPESLAKAELDPTLVVSSCYEMAIAYRKGLVVKCKPRLDASVFGYSA